MQSLHAVLALIWPLWTQVADSTSMFQPRRQLAHGQGQRNGPVRLPPAHVSDYYHWLWLQYLAPHTGLPCHPSLAVAAVSLCLPHLHPLTGLSCQQLSEVQDQLPSFTGPSSCQCVSLHCPCSQGCPASSQTRQLPTAEHAGQPTAWQPTAMQPTA